LAQASVPVLRDIQLSAMSMTPEERAAQEAKLRGMAEMLTRVGESMGDTASKEAVKGIAAEVNGYADKVRDAETLEEAIQAAEAAESKKASWIELLDLLTLSKKVEDEEDRMLMSAELKLQETATQLRSLSQRGQSAAFQTIGTLADTADTFVTRFQNARTAEAKWEVYAAAEEARGEWALQMTQLKNTQESAQTAQEVAEATAAGTKNKTADVRDALANQFLMQVGGGEPASSDDTKVPAVFYDRACDACSAAPIMGRCFNSKVKADYDLCDKCYFKLSESEREEYDEVPPPDNAMMPENVRRQVVTFLSSETGLINSLRTAVAVVKEDPRFEAIHEDAQKTLDQMEIAVGAIIPTRSDGLPTDAAPEQFSPDVAGAEQRVMTQVEPLRKAQWGAFYAKKHAWAVRKYDTYRRKGPMPKLQDNHPDLHKLCVQVTEVAEYLRKEAQGGVMDAITALVDVTQADALV